MRQHKQGLSLSIFLVALLFLASGCASSSAGSSPLWLDELYDKQYSEETYLCAVGSGSSRKEAADAALSSLSQVFSSQVKTVTTLLSLSTAQDDGSGQLEFTEKSEMVDQGRVTSATEKIVGAEVVNTYIDGNARVYVRVALHRKRTSELYQKEIDQLDISIMRVKRSLIAISDPLQRYFTLKKAVAFAQRQQNLYDQMQVLLKKSQNSTLLQLERELAEIASSVKVTVTVDSLEDHQVLFSAFSQKLLALGFTVVPLDANPSAFLALQYRCTPLEMQDSPYKYARYTLTAELASGSSTLVSFQKSEREAAISQEDAQKKALIQATTATLSEFFALLEQKLGDTT